MLDILRVLQSVRQFVRMSVTIDICENSKTLTCNWHIIMSECRIGRNFVQLPTLLIRPTLCNTVAAIKVSMLS